MSWMLNALHSTPDVGPASRDLLKLALPHINTRDVEFSSTLPFAMRITNSDSDEEEENEEEESDPSTSESEDEDGRPRKRRRIVETVPCITTGMYFTRWARVGQGYPCPRLDNPGSYLKPSSYKFHFGEIYETLLHSVFRLGTGIDAHPLRNPTKKRRTVQYYDEGQALPAETIALEQNGHRLPERPEDVGSDNEEEEFRPLQPGPNDEEMGLNGQATNLWRQGLLDVTSKCPNEKGFNKPPYCRLSPEQRRLVNMATYQNLKLSDYFMDCRYALRRDAPALWDLAFDNMFPPKGKAIKKGRQGYSQSEYFGIYEHLRSGPDEMVNALRKALKEKFDQLQWFPWLQADKMWKTSSSIAREDHRFRRCEGNTKPSSTPAPFVLIRTNTIPTW